jgi:hypothetical protein
MTDVKQTFKNRARNRNSKQPYLWLWAQYNYKDEIVLFDSEFPHQYHLQVQNLKLALAEAQRTFYKNA